MYICYNKLWKLLIDRKMMKKDLGAQAGISSATIAKLKKNEFVSTEMLTKICGALCCDISDIAETVFDEDEKNRPSA